MRFIVASYKRGAKLLTSDQYINPIRFGELTNYFIALSALQKHAEWLNDDFIADFYALAVAGQDDVTIGDT